jgi:hypothetical protein
MGEALVVIFLMAIGGGLVAWWEYRDPQALPDTRERRQMDIRREMERRW